MKRYLKTPEEVIDALQSGKVVLDESGYGYKCKMINGIIVNYTCDGGWGLNMLMSSCDNLYVEDPKPLKLEVGKFYKTRDGRKAFVYGKYSDTDETYPYAVVIVADPMSESTVTEKGERVEGSETCSDLVAPWEE